MANCKYLSASSPVSGLSFSIGAVIDEAQGAHCDTNYAHKLSSSNARSLIVFKWMVVGFLLTISYKSVLRAMLMKVYYEETIDTIDDMLKSERLPMAAIDTIVPTLLASDPREKVKTLAKRVSFYKLGSGRPSDVKYLVDGYIMRDC